MKRLQKAALIVELLDKIKAKGSWAGETHLQKCLFFLQKMRDVPTGYRFQIHHYGPYSFDLSDEIVQLKGDRIVVPFSRPYPYGPSLARSEASHRLRNSFSTTLKKYTNDMDFVAEHFGHLNAIELAKLSTAYYFILQDKDKPDRIIAKEVNREKSYISISAGLEAAEKVREIAGLK